MLAMPLISALPHSLIQPWQELGKKTPSSLRGGAGHSAFLPHTSDMLAPGHRESVSPVSLLCAATSLAAILCLWGTEGCPHQSWDGHLVQTKVGAQMLSWRCEIGPTKGVSASGGSFCLHLPLVMMYL